MIRRHISLASTVEEAYSRLPTCFRRQLVQAYRLAAVSCSGHPLALIKFAVQLARHCEQTDRIHAQTCANPNCPADEIEDQLMLTLLAIMPRNKKGTLWAQLPNGRVVSVFPSRLGGGYSWCIETTKVSRCFRGSTSPPRTRR
jgi:hypothetical protein